MVVELYSIYIVVMGWGGPFGCPARSVVEHVSQMGSPLSSARRISSLDPPTASSNV
jgi:hypothetical protein